MYDIPERALLNGYEILLRPIRGYGVWGIGRKERKTVEKRRVEVEIDERLVSRGL